MASISLRRLADQLNKEFPGVWIKDGAEFDSRHAGALWTGEGSWVEDEHGKDAAFDSYSVVDELYPNGVHHQLATFLEQRGFYCEFYDAGTVFIYPM